MTPEYIGGLESAKELTHKDILYGPKEISGRSNDDSTIKFLRSGAFTVLSLGDVESHGISSRIRGESILQSELDVMILAHHGADNGFTSAKLLKMLKPSVAVCSSDYDNKYDHPDQRVREMLFEHGVALYTTKTGDVLMHSQSTEFQVINLKANSTAVSSSKKFFIRRNKLLSGLSGSEIRDHYRQYKRPTGREGG